MNSTAWSIIVFTLLGSQSPSFLLFPNIFKLAVFLPRSLSALIPHTVLSVYSPPFPFEFPLFDFCSLYFVSRADSAAFWGGQELGPVFYRAHRESRAQYPGHTTFHG
jgi:hypothetical protein